MSEYDKSYYERGPGSGVAGAVGGFVSKLDVLLLAHNLSARGRGGRLLEIGFGDGTFLSAMARKGWEIRGIDVSEAAVAMARTRVGMKVDLGDILQRPYEGDFFDMVVMRHVLEHVEDAAAVLDEIYRILKPGGELCIIVPNIESTEAKIAGENWFHLDPEHHLSHFSPTTLFQLLELAGFQEMRMSQMGLNYTQTLTYSILSRIGLEVRPGNDLSFSRGRSILLYALLPFGVPLSFALSLLGRGGTMRFTARKSGNEL